MINVTVYNEFYHEKVNEKVASIYPNGIHKAIGDLLSADPEFCVRYATLDDINETLTDEILDNTDVLFWWGHVKHHEVPDAIVEKVCQRVYDGMGFIPVHSGHFSKPFKKLMGMSCNLKWRETEDKERIWSIEPYHPIAYGVPEYFDIPHEETYGERFDIPTPEDVIFIGNFSGGEVFRSGITYHRGLGKIFYFQPGHETYPIYHMPVVGTILRNAAHWCYTPKTATPYTLGFWEKR